MPAVFEHPVSVRWRDTDALGHVNHAVFLTYLEEGRDAFYLRAFGSDPSYVVVRIELDLRAEVRREDGQVVVQIAVVRIRTASLTTTETILSSAGEVVASGRIVTVRWDAEAHKAVPFSSAERAALTDFESA